MQERKKKTTATRSSLFALSEILTNFSWSCFSSCLVGRERRYARVRESCTISIERNSKTRVSYPICQQTGAALLLPFFHQKKKCYSDDSDKWNPVTVKTYITSYKLKNTYFKVKPFELWSHPKSDKKISQHPPFLLWLWSRLLEFHHHSFFHEDLTLTQHNTQGFKYFLCVCVCFLFLVGESKPFEIESQSAWWGWLTMTDDSSFIWSF